MLDLDHLVDAGQHEHELPGVQAGHQIIAARAVAQATGDCAQNTFACGLVQGLLRCVKPFQVQQQHGQWQRTQAIGQGLVEEPRQGMLITQACHGIVGGAVGQLGLGADMVGDVDHRTAVPDHA